MTTIEIEEVKRCQDSRNILIKLGSKVISSTGVMFQVRSDRDLDWIFDMDYDNECIEGLVMPFWVGNKYVSRLNEVKNQSKQLKINNSPSLSSFQQNLINFSKIKLALFDPSSETFYFSAIKLDKYNKESASQKKKALINFINQSKVPEVVGNLAKANPSTYYQIFEKIYNDDKQRSALITWFLIHQQNQSADVAFVPTPYLSGKETLAFELSINMNFEADSLNEVISVPIGHHYCFDANFFSDGDVVDIAIKMFEEKYLKFDKTYSKIVSIKLVNERFNDSPDAMENFKNFLNAIRKIRDNTGIIFILFNGMATGYAALTKGFDLYSFPTNGHTAAGYGKNINSDSRGRKAGIYDSKWLVKRNYTSTLRYFKLNGHLPVEGTYGSSIAFTDPESFDFRGWNKITKKILAEVKNNEAKKIREAIANGSIRIIREVFLASKRKEYIDIL